MFWVTGSEKSPPGGEIDKIPPTIIETFPANETINFNEDELEFSFSEYVTKRNINGAFFISPILEKNPEFSWTNKTLYVKLKEKLKENTTYSVIIGTEIADINNSNNMVNPFSLIFSTGSKIDSGQISGKVFSNKAKGTMIFAYKVDTGNVNIYENKPDYISQISNDGFYKIGGLANGEYLLYAVKDEFKDLVYNIGSDRIGLPDKAIKLSDDNNKFEDVNFLMTIEDTLVPNIQAVTMTDRNNIVVEFSEPIDSSRITANNFSIQDSTNNISIPVKHLCNLRSRKNEYAVSFVDSLNDDNDYYLIATNIYDKNNNKLSSEIVNFIAGNKIDTTAILIKKILTPYQNNGIDYLEPEFTILFSEAFSSEIKNDAIKMISRDSVNVPIDFKIINDSEIKVKAKNKLKPKKDYYVQVNMNYFEDAAGNKADTVLSKKLTTKDELDFSGVSGVITGTQSNNVRVVLRNIKNQVEPREINVQDKNQFVFKRVVPGDYLIWAYIDTDTNKEYSYGKINPFKSTEKFVFYSDTLNLRARWPVGDIEINFKNNK